MNVFIYLLVFISINAVAGQNDSYDAEVGFKSEILSRRKRFIVFPEGSSFQIVFCTTYPMVFSIGDIFLWGVTAALAWELPQDPYSPFDHHADPLHRRMDTKMIYYTSEEGKIIYKRPYTNKLIVNPAFSKRSVDGTTDKQPIDRQQMHAEHKRYASDADRSAFHRSGRASLYRKIEAMLQGLGTDGKQCMLKTLCMVGKSQDHPQGSFLQEILRTTFTLPKGFSQDDLDEYDAAFSAKGSCDELYPDCVEGVTEPMLRS